MLPTVETPISEKNVIEENMITFQQFDESQMKFNVAISKEEIVGLKVKTGRLIKTNAPIRKDDLEKSVVIKKGDEVRLFYITSGCEISTKAYATKDGCAGDKIPFHVESKKVVLGKVVHEGRAEIRESL
jgi:flagella basal body P-ring formation protein FlgA